MKPIEFHPEAQLEYEEVFAYYEQQRTKLGKRFRREVVKTLRFIRRFPQAGSKAGKTMCRKRRIDVFPYTLIYLIEANQTVVIAITHTSRHPEYWLHRLSP